MEFTQVDVKPDFSGEKVPPRCTLKVHQGHGSPYVQGVLPAGFKYKGYNSHSRSYDPDLGSACGSSSSSSGSKRALLTEQAAKTQVMAWLWGWWNHEGSKARKWVKPCGRAARNWMIITFFDWSQTTDNASDILSGILSDIYRDILSDLFSDILSGILSDI